MRTVRPMHHFDHRTRREATVVARTYLLEHYSLHPLYVLGETDIIRCLSTVLYDRSARRDLDGRRRRRCQAFCLLRVLAARATEPAAGVDE